MADDIKLVIGVDDRDLIKAQKEQLKFQRNIITIEKAFRNGDITAKRYNQELNKQTKELQKLGGSYRTASSEVRKYAYAMRQADDATLAQSQAMAFAGKKINRMGVGLQQAGYQIGDFAVQIQGGTNAAVALGQQGSQLLGIFGPAGAIAGAALAITTAFVAPLLKAGEATKNATEEIEKLRKELELLQSGAADQTTLDLNKQIAKVQNEIFDIQNRTIDLSYADEETKKQILAAAKANRQEDDEALKALQLQLVQLNLKKDAIRINKALANSEAQEQENIRANQQRINRERIEAEKRVAEALLTSQEEFDRLQKQKVMMSRAAGDERAAIEQEVTAQLIKSQDAYLKAIVEAHDAGKDLSKLDLKSPFDKALPAARLLAHTMNMSLIDALNLINAASADSGPVGKGRGKSTGAGGTASERLMLSLGGEFIPYPKKKSGGGSKKKDPLAELRKRITLEEELFGKTEAQRQVIQALGVDYEKVYGKPATDELIERINKLKELQEEEAKIADLAQTIGSAMEKSFVSMVDGTSSVKDAFRDMARDIVAHLYKVLVVQQMINSFGGMLSGSSNPIVSALGGALESYEGGGYTGSGSRSGGMDGRGGRLAMIHPRETVVDHTKAGSGGSGEAVVVNQTFNFAANGDDSVKKLIAQAAPQIANMTQKQIMDSRRRGGAMKSTFG